MKFTLFKAVSLILFLVVLSVIIFGAYSVKDRQKQELGTQELPPPFYQKLCPDVSAHFSNKLISEFLQERRNFYLQLTDRYFGMNQTFIYSY
jgi:hypothetical protein